ncbi:Lrp/AsnC family transcriptional regulator, partial [Mesorhizobium sp. M7A.F.Ca.US.003.02.2.1]
MKLDKIDIKILSQLQKNGRVTNVELADLVNLSPSPCLMRVKKLQAEGFITGYSAQIDVSKLGQTLTIFTEVTLKHHQQNDFARFLTAIQKVDSVIECHLISGGYD